MPKIKLTIYFKDPSSSAFHFCVSILTDSRGAFHWLRPDNTLAPPTFDVHSGPVSRSLISKVAHSRNCGRKEKLISNRDVTGKLANMTITISISIKLSPSKLFHIFVLLYSYEIGREVYS